MILALGERRPVFDGDGHFIADSASVVGSVRLGSGASIWFNCVLRGDNDWIEVGERSNIQDGAVLHTDPGLKLIVGKGVTVGHRATLHGCSIGNNALIGIGSTILNGARIGSNCLVGANALVTENKQFPDGSLIIGAPARVSRPLNAAEIESIEKSANLYVDNARRFATELQPA